MLIGQAHRKVEHQGLNGFIKQLLKCTNLFFFQNEVAKKKGTKTKEGKTSQGKNLGQCKNRE
jgi:hypothetical protein